MSPPNKIDAFPRAGHERVASSLGRSGPGQPILPALFCVIGFLRAEPIALGGLSLQERLVGLGSGLQATYNLGLVDPRSKEGRRGR